MRGEWEVKKISEVSDVIGGGTPSSKVIEYYGGNIPWITPKDLSNYKYRKISKGARYITELGLEKSSARLLPKNSVLLTSRAPIGYVAIADGKIATNQGFKSLVLKSGYDHDFFYYLLKNNIPLFESRASGSTFKEISGQVLKDTELLIPLYEEQIKIGNLLKSLDHKIELNTKTNETLEKLAQALFKSWFVDFDPVKVKEKLKQEGGDLDSKAKELGMSKEILELFPDEFEESNLGMIPKGWSISEIGKEIDVVGGGTPSTKVNEYWENGSIYWTTPKDLSKKNDKIIIDTERKITGSGLAKISSGLLPVNTVLMSSRAPVGYLALAKVPIAINQGYIAMKCKKTLTPEYVIQWCESVMDEIKQRASGTTFAEISKKNFKPIHVIVPKNKTITAYTKVVSELYKKIEKNTQQNKNLTQLRDTLLPKLLSGEITIESE